MINVKIDSKNFERQLKEFSKTLNKDASDSVVEIARGVSNQLAVRTKPYGNNKKSQDVAEKAITSDINKVYQNVGVTYNIIKQRDPKKAVAYAYCMNNGQQDKAEKIAEAFITNFDIGSPDDGQRLNSNRNSKGRVTEAKSPIGIKNNSEVDGLKAKKILTAGLAKSGWYEAGLSLLSKVRIPKWLKKSITGLGSATVVKAGWNTVVTLTNKVSYAKNNLTDSQVQAALRNGYQNQLKRMQKQIQASIDKLK